MCKLILLFTFIVCSCKPVKAQNLKLKCSQIEKKNNNGLDPILVRTCFIKEFKFISTSHPDYAGRYLSTEHEVFIKVKGKYIRTKSSKFFNRRQTDLLALINQRIRSDFDSLKSDKEVNECLSHIDTIPKYNMDDLQISFYEDEIWFEVHWGLGTACNSVDGTIVSFKINEVSKYLN